MNLALLFSSFLQFETPEFDEEKYNFLIHQLDLFKALCFVSFYIVSSYIIGILIFMIIILL